MQFLAAMLGDQALAQGLGIGPTIVWRFRLMGSQHSESCEASVGGTIPGHGKPLRVLD